MTRKIKEVFPNLLVDGGIFKQIFSNDRFGDLTAIQMGLAFFSHSGEKLINSLIENFVGENGKVSDADEAVIGALINDYFGDNWDRYFTTLSAEYNPVENYDKNSLITDTESGTDTNNVGGVNVTHTIGNTEENRYFKKANSIETYTRDSEQERVTSNQHTTSDVSQPRIDSTTYGHTVTHNEHTHGNIGVTTGAQMVSGEIETRRRLMMFDIIIKDIDNFITLKIY